MEPRFKPQIVGPRWMHLNAGFPYRTQKSPNDQMGIIHGGTKSRPLAKSPKPSKQFKKGPRH